MTDGIVTQEGPSLVLPSRRCGRDQARGQGMPRQTRDARRWPEPPKRGLKAEAGLFDPKAEAYRDHEARPLADHLDDFRGRRTGRRERPSKHVKGFTDFARRSPRLSPRARSLGSNRRPRRSTGRPTRRSHRGDSSGVLTDARLSDLDPVAEFKGPSRPSRRPVDRSRRAMHHRTGDQGVRGMGQGRRSNEGRSDRERDRLQCPRRPPPRPADALPRPNSIAHLGAEAGP